ncbi:hypothetical protein [Nonomuraea sp. B19D2]
MGRSEHLYVHFRACADGAVRTFPAVQAAGSELASLTGLLERVTWPKR